MSFFQLVISLSLIVVVVQYLMFLTYFVSKIGGKTLDTKNDVFDKKQFDKENLKIDCCTYSVRFLSISETVFLENKNIEILSNYRRGY